MVKRPSQLEDLQTVLTLAKAVVNTKEGTHYNVAFSTLNVDNKFNLHTWHDDIKYTLKWIKANRKDYMLDQVAKEACKETHKRKRVFESMIERASDNKKLKKNAIDPVISSLNMNHSSHQKESTEDKKPKADDEEDENSDLKFSEEQCNEEHSHQQKPTKEQPTPSSSSSSSSSHSSASSFTTAILPTDSNHSKQNTDQTKGKTNHAMSEIPYSHTFNQSQLNVDWKMVCHSRVMDVEGSLGIMKIIGSQRKGTMSLRYYATQALAPFVQRMKQRNLETVAWKDGWVHLWNATLLRGEDSFKVFQMFANAFAHEPNFACHDELTYSGKFLTKQTHRPSGDLIQYSNHYKMEAYGGIRRYFLKDRLIQNCNYHRIEFLPPQVSLLSLSKSLNTQTFNYVTLLNLSHKNYQREVLLQVVTLPHLIALDATNCNIDANIMFCWMLAMRNGLLPDLRMLCLGLNDIAMGTSMIVACPFLTYVEYDHSIDTIYTNWGRWVRRHALHEKIVAAYGRGNINKPGAPNFARNHFPKCFGISQKFFELKKLYSEMKKYPPPNPPPAYPFLIQPDFGVPYTGKSRVILQEFNCAESRLMSKDPEEFLWRDFTTSSPHKFLQEFYRFKHSQVTQQLLQNVTSSSSS